MLPAQAGSAAAHDALKVAVVEHDPVRRSGYQVGLEDAGHTTLGFRTIESLVLACRARVQRFDVLLLACGGDVLSVTACLASAQVDVLRAMPMLLVVEERQVHAVHQATRAGRFDFILSPFDAPELCARVRWLGAPRVRPGQHGRAPPVAQALSSPAGP